MKRRMFYQLSWSGHMDQTKDPLKPGEKSA